MSSVVIMCLLLVYCSNGDILNNNKAALQRPIGLTNYQMKNGFNRISKEASKVSNEALKVQNEALKVQNEALKMQFSDKQVSYL